MRRGKQNHKAPKGTKDEVGYGIQALQTDFFYTHKQASNKIQKTKAMTTSFSNVHSLVSTYPIKESVYSISLDIVRSYLRISREDVSVRLSTELSLDLERTRSVMLLHNHFDQLDLLSVGERLVIQKCGELVLSADGI